MTKNNNNNNITKPNVFRTADGQYVNDKNQPLQVVNQTFQDPAYWTYQDASGNLYVPQQLPTDSKNATIGKDYRVDINKSNREYKDRMNRYADIAHSVGTGLMDASMFVGPEMGALVNGARMYLADAMTNTAAGQFLNGAKKYALSKIVAPRLFGKNIPKVWDGTVPYSYFNSSDYAYRFTETPEFGSMRELGFNTTTNDAEKFPSPSNRFRESLMDMTKSGNNIRAVDGGWQIRKHKLSFFKRGSAHGNMTQFSKKKPWEGTVARSGLFPFCIMEVRAPQQVYAGRGLSRSKFDLTPWSEIKSGHRIGFPTKTIRAGEDVNQFVYKPRSDGYKYEGAVLPYKQIRLIETPSGLQEQYINNSEMIPESKSISFPGGGQVPTIRDISPIFPLDRPAAYKKQYEDYYFGGSLPQAEVIGSKPLRIPTFEWNYGKK